MSSQVNRIDINESRPTNKRPPTHFQDDTAQRSKRLTSGAAERGLSSVSQAQENRSPDSGVKPVSNHADLTMQPDKPVHDPRVLKDPSLQSSPVLANLSSRNGQRSLAPSNHGQRNLGQALEIDNRQVGNSPPSSPGNTYNEQDEGILLQPETRPITQEQLVNEVKGVSLVFSFLRH